MGSSWLSRAASILLTISGASYLASGLSFSASLIASAAERGLWADPLEGFAVATVGLTFSVIPSIIIIAAISLIASYRLWRAKGSGALLGAAASALGVAGALHFAPLTPILLPLLAVNSATLILTALMLLKPT